MRETSWLHVILVVMMSCALPLPMPSTSAHPMNRARGGNLAKPDRLAKFHHGDIKNSGVYRSLPLELQPDAINRRSRENDIELHHRPAVRQKRMRVDHVDEVAARDEHVP